jgi:hypothetical protein
VIKPLQMVTVQVPKVNVPETPPPQQTAFAPFDIRTWPAVPQELAQSTMPAPGLIAFVLHPVSQLLLPKPIASWQEPFATGKEVTGPMRTF